METENNVKIVKTLKCLGVILVLLSMCLYFNNLDYGNIAAIRSYFVIGFTVLFFALGCSFFNYRFSDYKKYFKDYIFKFLIYSLIYLFIAGVILLINIFTLNNGLGFFTNAIDTIVSLPFVFKNFWIVPVYIIIALLLPFINKKVIKSNYSPVIFAAIILILILNEVTAPLLPNLGYVRTIYKSMCYVLFYGLITVLGLSLQTLTNKHGNSKVYITLMLLLNLALVIACLVIYGYDYDLSSQFNPPTFFLVVYHMLILTVAYYFLPKVLKFLNYLENKKIIRHISNYALPITLLSPVVFYLLNLLFKLINIEKNLNQYFILGFLVYLGCAVLILTVICFITVLINKMRQNKLTDLKKEN